jgi:nitrite reductase (NADH) large subunit
MKEKLVLVGNGMAGVRTLEELLKLAPERYDITVFGAEPYGNYNRIMLSPVLAGEKTIDEIMLNDEQWYTDNGITLHKGKQIVEIDRARRTVRAADGTEESYDRLILATGSLPFIIPVPGKELPGVVAFRDIHDVDRMLEAAHATKGATAARWSSAAACWGWRPPTACTSRACTSASCICWIRSWNGSSTNPPRPCSSDRWKNAVSIS